MSSEVKAEEAPAVVEAPPKVEDAPAVVENPVAVKEESITAPTVEAVAEVAEDKDKEVKSEEAKADPVEVKIITEGLLDIRPHGILHFISTKRFFFYMQDEHIGFDNLGAYIKKEKKVHPDAAQSTAAYASQSGKGLLFFVKNESQRAQPMGIIKLADVVDVSSAGTSRFSLKMTNEVLDFIALSTADRDSWVHSINLKVAEAKECVESITTSEGYKAALEKFSKKGKEKEEEEKDEKKEEEKEKKDKRKKKEEGAKSDSSSDSSSSDESSDKKGKKIKRAKSKRASLFFGGIIGHRDRKHEKEDKKEDKLEEEPKVDQSKAELTVGPSTDAPTAATVEETSGDKPAEETAKPEEATVDEATTSRSGRDRRSVFGFWTNPKLGRKGDAEPTKDREIVSDTPPVIAPFGEESKETPEEAKAVDAAPPPPVGTGAKTPSSPPKESFLDKLFKPKEKVTPVTAGPSTDAKKDEVSETKQEEANAAKEGDAVKDSDEKVPEASPKDGKRRSSFFSSLGKNKEKRSDVKSDTEDEPASKSTPGSPLPRINNLFRKNSKSAKDAPKVDEDVPPVPEVTLGATVVEAVVIPATTDAPAAEEQTIIVAETTTTTIAATTDTPATTV